MKFLMKRLKNTKRNSPQKSLDYIVNNNSNGNNKRKNRGIFRKWKRSM